MAQMKPHGLFLEDEEGNDTQQAAWVTLAKSEDAEQVIAQTTEGHDGRSPWVWVRMQNGTLLLATFPQGDTYCQFSDTGVCDFEWVEASCPG